MHHPLTDGPITISIELPDEVCEVRGQAFIVLAIEDLGDEFGIRTAVRYAPAYLPALHSAMREVERKFMEREPPTPLRDPEDDAHTIFEPIKSSVRN